MCMCVCAYVYVYDCSPKVFRNQNHCQLFSSPKLEIITWRQQFGDNSMETPTGVFIMDGGDRAQGRAWKVASRILASLTLTWRLAQNGQPLSSPGDISVVQGQKQLLLECLDYP